MKLEDTREEYYFYTGKVSDLVRQLGFAGIAIIWVFRTSAANGPQIPKELIPAGVLIVLSLAADLLQYAAGAVIWDRFNLQKEAEIEQKLKKLKKDGKSFDPEAEDFTAPASINTLTKWLFRTKFSLMFVTYVYLVVFLVVRLTR